MPRDPFKPLLPREQAFVFHWVREGCHVERMAIVERKAKLKKGDGPLLLNRPHVQREIDAKKSLVLIEEARLIARDQNRNAEKEDQRREVTLDHIERRLAELMDLDLKTHGPLVHAALQTAMVYTGVVRSQKLERTIPIKNPSGDADGTAASSVYAAVFGEVAVVAAATVAGTGIPAAAPLHPDEMPLPPPIRPPEPGGAPPAAAPPPAPVAPPLRQDRPKKMEIEIS